MARKSHVKARSKRYAARQFVSDTHDHKPDAPSHEKPRPPVEEPAKE